jgi:hypothetical protein
MFSMSFLLLVISAVLLSILIPWTYKKWEKEVDVSAIPLAVILSNFMSIMILATFLYV